MPQLSFPKYFGSRSWASQQQRNFSQMRSLNQLYFSEIPQAKQITKIEDKEFNSSRRKFEKI